MKGFRFQAGFQFRFGFQYCFVFIFQAPQQARKPQSYASPKLRLTDLLSGVECRATSVAKKWNVFCAQIIELHTTV